MTVEVCPICDIAGCRHIRERNAMTARNSHEETDMIMSREDVQKLLDAATPGPWQYKRLNSHDPQVVSAAGAICDVGGYADPNPANVDDIANAHLIATAPDLARSLLAAHDEIDRLRALIGRYGMNVGHAEGVDFTVGPFLTPAESVEVSTLIDEAERTRAIAPASGLARLAELRGRAEKAEADLRESLAVNKRLNTWLDGDTAALVAERDRLAADNARLEAQVEALTGAMTEIASLDPDVIDARGQILRAEIVARAALSAHDAKAGEGAE